MGNKKTNSMLADVELPERVQRRYTEDVDMLPGMEDRRLRGDIDR